jgi:chromosomal replication initiation ATPase DnaA
MHSSLWQNILSSISSSIDEHRFETWFRPLVLNCSNDINTLSLSAPNQFIADFLDQNYKHLVLSTAQNFSNDIKNVVFTVGSLPSHFSDAKHKESSLSSSKSEPHSSFPQLNKLLLLVQEMNLPEVLH